MKYTLGEKKIIKFGVDVPDHIESPLFKLKIYDENQRCLYSERCQYIPLASTVIAELQTKEILPSDKNYFIELKHIRLDRLKDETLWAEPLFVERYSNKENVDKKEIKKKVKKQPTFLKEKKAPETFETVKQEYLKFVNEQTTAATVGGVDQTHLSGQTRAIGRKDGIITRLKNVSPSASKVSEDDDIFIQSLDFISRIDPDLLDDEQELAVHELLADFLTFTDKMDEARFSNRVPPSKKVALRRYQRAHKQRIKQRLKQRKKTIAGIIHDKKRKKREKLGQRADGSRMRKNHIMSKGAHRRTK